MKRKEILNGFTKVAISVAACSSLIRGHQLAVFVVGVQIGHTADVILNQARPIIIFTDDSLGFR